MEKKAGMIDLVEYEITHEISKKRLTCWCNNTKKEKSDFTKTR